MLVNLAGDVLFWHTPDGDAYATISVEGHREHHAVRSRRFKTWLARQYFVTHDAAANAKSMVDALGIFEGKALFEGKEHEIHVRVAEADEMIYLDLANPKWQAIAVTAEGWGVVDEAPVKFRRSASMLPLPTPERGGPIGDLRKFINVTDQGWILVLAWIVCALRPKGPYAILALNGEHGSAKSTTARVLRSLIDPCKAALRCEIRHHPLPRPDSESSDAIATDRQKSRLDVLAETISKPASDTGDRVGW